MVFKEMLEYERTIRSLQEILKDKPKGYVTELKINGYAFSKMKNPKIEIVLLDPKDRLIAYRPKPGNEGHKNEDQWFFGDFSKAVEDAFFWINKSVETQKDQRGSIQETPDDKSPEYTLMGIF